MAPGHLDPVRAIAQNGGYGKVNQIVEGGQTRNESTSRALEALGTDECNVLFHDAVRPLVSQTIISDCVAALATHEAVDTAIPSADTIVQVHESAPAEGLEAIEDVLQRSLLRRGQTPQAFRLSVIRKAYELAWQDPDFTATDDCTVVLRYLPDVPIAVVAGHERNMKVTEPIDVYLADKLFQLRSMEAPGAMGPEDYRRAFEGRTLVVFTAGMLPQGLLTDATEETVVSSTEVNYLAPVFIAQEFHPHLVRSGGSLLLFTSSSY